MPLLACRLPHLALLLLVHELREAGEDALLLGGAWCREAAS